MALTIGDEDATTGMTKDIYDELLAVLEPDLEDLDEDTLEQMRQSWKKMAYAVAKGVIEHIQAHMEIQGVQTQGNVATTIGGDTDSASSDNHQHSVDLSGTQNNVTFTQSNDGTGLVA